MNTSAPSRRAGGPGLHFPSEGRAPPLVGGGRRILPAEPAASHPRTPLRYDSGWREWSKRASKRLPETPGQRLSCWEKAPAIPGENFLPGRKLQRSREKLSSREKAPEVSGENFLAGRKLRRSREDNDPMIGSAGAVHRIGSFGGPASVGHGIAPSSEVEPSRPGWGERMMTGCHGPFPGRASLLLPGASFPWNGHAPGELPGAWTRSQP